MPWNKPIFSILLPSIVLGCVAVSYTQSASAQETLIFDQSSYTFSVMDNGVVGTVNAANSANDYSLGDGDTNDFSISNTGEISYNGGTVATAMTHTFSVNVSSPFSSVPPASATVEVVVTATAVAPVFTPASYAFTVSDSGTAGTVVATDANGDTLSYSLVSGGSGVFSVSTAGANGVVSYSGGTETAAVSYTLMVSASDGALTATATVEVVVTATAVAPVFMPASYTFTVSDLGTAGTVGATDANGDTLTYSLVSGSSGVFSVSTAGANGMVSYSGGTETAAVSYTLMVSAQDAGGLSASATVEVVVAATAVAPVFDAASYAFTVSNAGTAGTVEATDANGGALTYSLVSGGSGVFSVSTAGANGVVSYSGGAVDNEVSYTLVVSAQDAGGLSASATVTVLITATAVAPVFDAASYAFTVSNAGTAGTVEATDANGGALTYSLVSVSGGSFSVGATSGAVLYNGGAVDNEVSYTLMVSVQDAGGLSASATVTVLVAATAVAPVFVPASYAFTVSDSGTAGTVVATDANGDTLTYSLVSGGSGSFSVDAASGAVYYSGEAVAATVSYTLMVSASDGALAATAMVEVVVRATALTTLIDKRTQLVAAVIANVGRNTALGALNAISGRLDTEPHIIVSGAALVPRRWADGAWANGLSEQWKRQWAELSRGMDWDYWRHSGKWDGKQRALSGDVVLGKHWDQLEAKWQRRFDDYRAQWNKFRKGMVSGSSFLAPLGASGEGTSAGLTGWTVWGKGHASGYERVSDGLRSKGRSLSGYLGADYQAAKGVLLGVALSRSKSDGYAERTTGDAGRIDVDTTMTTVWPYVNWDFGAGSSLWGSLGRGTGTAEIDDQGVLRKTDIEMSAALFGAKRRLLLAGNMWISVKADGFVVEIESDAIDGYLGKTNPDAYRLRMALSANNRWQISNTTSSRAGIEFGARRDGGDSLKGRGFDLGGHVGYNNAALGISLNSRARVLVAHSEDYREWGLDATVEIRPGMLGRGVSLRLAPRWGQATTEIDKLWTGGVSAVQPASSGRALLPDQTQLSLSYGLGYGGVALRPYASLEMQRGTLSDMNLGLKLNSDKMQFSVFGNRVHDLGVSGMLRW